MSIVTARDLAVGYNGTPIASIGDLALAAGDRLAVTGANGSGKTTLLKTLARLIPPIAGELHGPAPGRGGAVYVHPAAFLFAGTGEQNVLLGAHGNHAEAKSAIEAVGASAFSHANVRTMSHGQRQRIALARAIACAPSLLLVDEPETGLDSEGLASWKRLLASWPGAIVVAAPEYRNQNTEYRMLSLSESR